MIEKTKFNAAERVRKMKSAINSDIKEKCQEILENGLEQFRTEKESIMRQQKNKINTEFIDKREKAVVANRIANSTMINDAKIQKMSKRYEKISDLKKSVQNRFQTMVNDEAEYKKLIRSLMIECLLKLMDRDIVIKCRKADIEIVRSLQQEVQQEFREKVKAECNNDIDCKITVSEEDLKKTKKNCIGGVVASCNFGKIVCSNTLEDRVELAFQDFLPDIRKQLFPDYK